MLKKIYNSLAFRSGSVYRFILSKLPTRKYKKPVSSDFKMISLCGKSHISYLKQSLHSIFKSFTLIPLIEIYTDGSLSPELLEKNLSEFRPYIKVSDWKTCITETTDDEKRLATFADKHPIGRKLMVIIWNAKKSPTLWWDTDILWFQDSASLLLPKPDKNFFIKSTQDYQPSYSANMLGEFPEAIEKPFINTGLVYLNGDVLETDKLSGLLDIASKNPDHFSEQTILAKSVLTSGKHTWGLDKIACTQSDQLTMAATYPKRGWIARHYVGPVRHLFWRDSLFMRLGVKP